MTLLLIILVAVILIVIATGKFKIHPFIALLLASFFVGIFARLPLTDIVTSINSGFGGLMTGIGLVIVEGTLIGLILERSGAALRMAEVVLRVVGPKRPQLAMSLIGYIVSIPVFCDSAFIILSSLKKSLAKRAGVTIASMAVALSTGLYATHVFVPPTPGPIAAAGNLGISDSLGTVILLGLIVAIPAMLIGYLWAITVGTRIHVAEDDDNQYDHEQIIASFGEMPSTFKSFLPIVLPILLIGVGSLAALIGTKGHAITDFFLFLGAPTVALFLGILSALPLLPEYTEKTLSTWVGDSLKDAAPILLITGAGGAFGSVIKTTGVGEVLQQINFGALTGGSLFLLVPFLISAALKTAQGSSTAALVITSTLVAPLLSSMGIDSTIAIALVVMAIGAGAMTVSHVNDSYFWVVTEYSGMSVSQAYKAQTMATLLQGLTSIIFCIILWQILV